MGTGSSMAVGGEWTRAVAVNARDVVLHGTVDSSGWWWGRACRWLGVGVGSGLSMAGGGGGRAWSPSTLGMG